MRKDRDKQLGDALRRLPAPTHRDGFFEAVWTGISTTSGSASAWRSERSSLWSVLARAPMALRRPRLALAVVVVVAVVAAVVLFGLPAGKRIASRFQGGSTAQGPVFPGPEPARAATAAEIALVAQRALRAAHLITADAAGWYGGPGDEPNFAYATRLILAADRSSRMTAPWGTSGSFTGTYDARTGVERVWGWGADPDGPSVEFFTEEYVGIPPGEPDGDWLPVGGDLADFWFPSNIAGGQLFAAVARVAQADPDAVSRTGRFDGRPVWIVSCRVVPNSPVEGSSAQRMPRQNGSESKSYELSVSVDQQTGLPVRVQSLVDGEPVAEGRLVNLKVDPDVSDDVFTTGLPTAADVERGGDGRLYLRVRIGDTTASEPLPFDPKTVAPDDVTVSIPDTPGIKSDHGFRRVPLDEVGAAIGRDALAPTWLPGGFRLEQVAVKTQQRAPRTSDIVGRARAGTGIVVLRYQNGFQTVTVTTRELDPRVTDEGSAVRTDPFIGRAWPGQAHARSSVRVAGGAFSGARGAVVIGPLTIPHLWAVQKGMLLTIAADASAKQLLRIADSMQAWTPAASPGLPGDDPPPD